MMKYGFGGLRSVHTTGMLCRRLGVSSAGMLAFIFRSEQLLPMPDI